jgi:hypothetical protein
VEAFSRWYVDGVIAPPIEVGRNGLITLPARKGMRYGVDIERIARYRLRFGEFSA